ncbi:hypothetical protein VU07_02325 [Desulfobulbus sp. F4]|nr:hypothetical protein [Desulfobulbus sp. F3]MCW5200636.1 hypothetical protein [Desulfobulbus sp. F4]
MKTGKVLLVAAAMLGLNGCYYYTPQPAVVAPAPGIMVPAPSIVVPVVPSRSYHHRYYYDDHRRYPRHHRYYR